MHDAHVVPALTDDQIAIPLRLALGDEGATPGPWTIRPLADGRGRAGNAYRVAGDARVGSDHVPWSLILKIEPVSGNEEDGSAFYYWKREFLAYQSHLLADLPGGIAAPGVLEPSSIRRRRTGSGSRTSGRPAALHGRLPATAGWRGTSGSSTAHT